MLKILVVDDEPSLLVATRRLLLRRGFDVATAGSAQQALEQLSDVSPDVLISDFRMAGMNGAQLLAAVAKRDPTIRRILVSGDAHALAGLDAFLLPKPWNEAELVAHCALGRLCLSRPDPVDRLRAQGDTP